MMDNVNANQELRDNSAMLVMILLGISDLQDVLIVTVWQKEASTTHQNVTQAMETVCANKMWKVWLDRIDTSYSFFDTILIFSYLERYIMWYS